MGPATITGSGILGNFQNVQHVVGSIFVEFCRLDLVEFSPARLCGISGPARLGRLDRLSGAGPESTQRLAKSTQYVSTNGPKFCRLDLAEFCRLDLVEFSSARLCGISGPARLGRLARLSGAGPEFTQRLANT